MANVASHHRPVRTHFQFSIRLLLRRHGSVYSAQTALQSALITAYYQPQVVDRILQEQPDVNETSSSGATALHVGVVQPFLTKSGTFLPLVDFRPRA